MILGPVPSREIAGIPRRPRRYFARAAYAATLLVLIATAWQVVTGTQVVRGIGDLARFDALVFQILAPLQLVVCGFLAAVSAALAVSQEKDRRTLQLLLLTRLSNAEVVLGELAAGLIPIAALLVASAPVFMLLALLGGVAFSQIGLALLVTAAAILVCGSIGSTLAFWREKTFQTLAITVLVLVCWTGLWEAVSRGALLLTEHQAWAVRMSPWHAVVAATRPSQATDSILLPGRSAVDDFLVLAVLAAAAINGVAIIRVRVWNAVEAAPARLERPPQAIRGDNPQPVDRFGFDQDASRPSQGIASPSRAVWNDPVLWREVRTWAYGRRVIALKIVYLLAVALAVTALVKLETTSTRVTRFDTAFRLAPLLVISLFLVNAQAVTSITNERDGQTLDLLLVTDIAPREFIAGKLLGTLYNTKEMVLLPMVLCGLLWYLGEASAENLAYLLGAWLVMVGFAAVLGLHTGMAYASSRAAIAVSLGTLFFLFVGVATCMRIMVAFSGSFSFQLQPFLAAMVGGFVGLYLALGARNPSTAIAAASFVCPVATLYALTSFLLGYTLAVFLVLVAAYGFAAAAMLVPAVHEFDVAAGQSTGREEV